MSDIARLRATVETFCQFIEALPSATVVEQAWGPKEVLAHLVFHHESYVDQVEAYCEGEPFAPPRGRFSDINAQAVAGSRGVPGLELIQRFLEANETLCTLYETVAPRRLSWKLNKGQSPARLTI